MSVSCIFLRVHCIIILIVGTLAAFRRVYEDPILVSRQPTASSEERLLGQNRARELNRITSLFILRRTQDVNNQYLPPRGLHCFDTCVCSELKSC